MVGIVGKRNDKREERKGEKEEKSVGERSNKRSEQ